MDRRSLLNRTGPEPRPRTPFIKLIRRAFFGATLLGLLLAGAAVYWIDSAPAAARGGIFEVAPGTPALRIVRDLKDQGLIRSRAWFMGWVQLRGAAGKFKSGAYDVPRGMGATRLLSLLLSGKTRRAKVSIPEGFAVWQVAERLQALNVCLAHDFEVLASSVQAEGTLYPDTYYFEEHMAPAAVLRIMQKRFDDTWEPLIAEAVSAGVVVPVGGSSVSKWRLSNGAVMTRLQIVTMASLIEREARRPEERVLISAVYHNRLKKRMYLEADPTVQYALGYWKDRLLFRDLDVQSPYNTYRRFGLPPGPICNPGRASLLAAMSPASASSLYFVADQTGSHVFSDTFDDHKRNVRDRNRARRALRHKK
jgi:UPF0755 protein